jgi:ABC-type polar amino acid transport system ATPase subunit
MASVRLENVRKNFAGTHVLHGIDLQIDDGEFDSVDGDGDGVVVLIDYRSDDLVGAHWFAS